MNIYNVYLNIYNVFDAYLYAIMNQVNTAGNTDKLYFIVPV